MPHIAKITKRTQFLISPTPPSTLGKGAGGLSCSSPLRVGLVPSEVEGKGPGEGFDDRRIAKIKDVKYYKTNPFPRIFKLNMRLQESCITGKLAVT